jgi:hypothetical protein
MKRWPLVALSLVVALCSPSPPSANAQAVDGKSELGNNAAIKYWQAFGVLPRLDRGQEKILQEWNKTPLDAEALKLIESSQNSRNLVISGASLRRCDWSLDYDKGYFMLMPHGVNAMTLARLTALHARGEFEQGRWSAGAEDVAAILKLARHVETDPIMILQMMGHRIETIAIDAAAPYVTEFQSAASNPVSAALETLPDAPTIAQMLQQEKRSGPLWLIEQLKAAEKRRQGSWQAVWNESLAPLISAAEGGESLSQDFVRSITSFEQAVKAAEDILPLYDELAKLTALPAEQFDAKYPEFFKRSRAASPLASAYLPAVDRVVASERRARAQTAMFKAALAVVQGGPEKLKNFKDPFGAGPFGYRSLRPGFELKSNLIHQQKPLTLMFGQGHKE